MNAKKENASVKYLRIGNTASTALAVCKGSLIQSLYSYNDLKPDGMTEWGLPKTMSYKVPFNTSDEHGMTFSSFEYETTPF